MVDKKIQNSRSKVIGFIMNVHKIEPRDSGQRLDKFLVGKIKDFSRSQIQKKIQAGLVLVNKKPAKVHQFLKEGDEIEIQKNKKVKKQENKAETMLQEPKIIFENENYIIVEKPPGLLVHETQRKEAHTLVSWLVKKYPEIEKVGEEKYRAGIIHRLDKDVSGIMIVAKTHAMYEHLKKQFKERKVKKEYLALVYGVPSRHGGEIEIPIGRNKEGKFVAHPRVGKILLQKKDRTAITKFTIEKKLRNFSLLRMQILTGRTHQIRIHLSWFGHPIVGDAEYGPTKNSFKKFSKKIKVVLVPRVMLHSHKIGFENLLGEWKEYNSPLPQEFSNFVDEI